MAAARKDKISIFHFKTHLQTLLHQNAVLKPKLGEGDQNQQPESNHCSSLGGEWREEGATMPLPYLRLPCVGTAK